MITLNRSSVGFASHDGPWLGAQPYPVWAPKDSIHWHYRCFDRILLNGLVQPFQQPERVVGFFNSYRQLYPVTRYTLRDIADQFQRLNRRIGTFHLVALGQEALLGRSD
jgi:hypothetical protein